MGGVGRRLRTSEQRARRDRSTVMPRAAPPALLLPLLGLTVAAAAAGKLAPCGAPSSAWEPGPGATAFPPPGGDSPPAPRPRASTPRACRAPLHAHPARTRAPWRLVIPPPRTSAFGGFRESAPGEGVAGDPRAPFVSRRVHILGADPTRGQGSQTALIDRRAEGLRAPGRT